MLEHCAILNIAPQCSEQFSICGVEAFLSVRRAFQWIALLQVQEAACYEK